MKKAFILLAHQLPEQLNIFIDQLLADRETDVYLHVNKLNDAIRAEIQPREGLFITDRNMELHWGSDEILKAMILLIREAVESGKEYEYIIFGSGQDMLIRNDLNEFLETKKGQVFLDNTMPLPQEQMNTYVQTRLIYKWPQAYRRLYNNRYHPCRILRSLRYRACMKGIALGKKKINLNYRGLTFYKDYYHFALPMEAARYILEVVDKDTEFMKMYSGAFIPEECFFSTVIMNSRFASQTKITNGIIESISYRAKEQNDHPVILTMKDKEELEQSGFFIARKFDIREDQEVIRYFHDVVTQKYSG